MIFIRLVIASMILLDSPLPAIACNPPFLFAIWDCSKEARETDRSRGLLPPVADGSPGLPVVGGAPALVLALIWVLIPAAAPAARLLMLSEFIDPIGTIIARSSSSYKISHLNLARQLVFIR
jgi:hypothetical protein